MHRSGPATPVQWRRLEGARYLLVGGLGYLVNLVTFAACIAAGLDEYAALAPAFALNTANNFFLNRAWTFGSSGAIGAQAARFGVVAIVLLVTNYASFHVLFGVVGLPDISAQALAIMIGLPIGFTMNRAWTFRTDRS